MIKTNAFVDIIKCTITQCLWTAKLLLETNVMIGVGVVSLNWIIWIM
jgi:hypothetical protein